MLLYCCTIEKILNLPFQKSIYKIFNYILSQDEIADQGKDLNVLLEDSAAFIEDND